MTMIQSIIDKGNDIKTTENIVLDIDSTNAAKMLIKAFAYNIINIMKRVVFPVDMHKNRLSSIRTSIIKIACRCIKTGRKIRTISKYFLYNFIKF